MKNVLILIILMFTLMGLEWMFSRNSPKSEIKDSRKPYSSNSLPTTHYALPTPSRSLFIPYWVGKVEENDMVYDNYYYFGVRPTSEGAIENEVGLQNTTLVDKIPEKQKKLVLRMLDSTVTEAIIKENGAKKMLISELQIILSKNAFSGIVVDLEVPFTLQAEKKEQITKFVQQICTAVKSDYKTCSILIYGDYSYRNRPYDVKALAEVVDTVLLMAYDFHKAGGEPGPNFPLSRRSNSEGGPETNDYDYDFKQMISDTIALVPKEKIEVVFGMYGYDWTLNEQGTPLKSATALSLNELKLVTRNLKLIKNNIEKLQVTSYKLQINKAREKSIHYIDADGRSHVIWYEDEESAAIKTTYLLEQGISRVSYWAYTYY